MEDTCVKYTTTESHTGGVTAGGATTTAQITVGIAAQSTTSAPITPRIAAQSTTAAQITGRVAAHSTTTAQITAGVAAQNTTATPITVGVSVVDNYIVVQHTITGGDSTAGTHPSLCCKQTETQV